MGETVVYGLLRIFNAVGPIHGREKEMSEIPCFKGFRQAILLGDYEL
jgi:hypothetical protein